MTAPSAASAADDPGTAEGDTLWALFERRVALSPDRMMLVDERDRRFSFAEVLAWCERVAAGLGQLGVGEGTAVTWQLPTRIETVVLSMALSRLGAVQNPVIALYRAREVGSLLRTTRAEWLAVPRVWRGFDHAAMAEQLRGEVEHPFRVLDVDAGLPEGDPVTLPPAPADPDAVRWLYATSGTTSEPKAVCHTDATLIVGGTGIAVALAPTGADRGSIPFPYAHIGGPDYLVMMLRCGLGALLLESFVPTEAVELFTRHGVTITGGSTAHYLAFLELQRRQPDRPLLPSVRLFSGGGAPKPAQVYWDVKRELGIEIHHGYGMTECPMIANGAEGDTDEQLAETEGAPVRACEVRVVDGEIQVRGPMLAKRYTDPELTKQLFLDDGFFRTGDQGVLRPDGHVVVTGRTKEVIIRKGENISPREIEDVLMAHPKVGAVAVIGVADPARGERVLAVVEPAPGSEPLTFAELQAACHDAGLMVQKIPEQLELVDALPRSPTMKILKRELVARFGSGRT